MGYTSRLKRTPPIGEPNETEIPAAAAADSASRFRAMEHVSSVDTAGWEYDTYLHWNSGYQMLSVQGLRSCTQREPRALLCPAIILMQRQGTSWSVLMNPSKIE